MSGPERVAVVFGGPSTEHEVSLSSAQSAIAEMHSMGWDVLSVGVNKQGLWYVGPDALARLVEQASPDRLPLSLKRVEHPATDLQIFDGPPPVEVFKNHRTVFPICHGQWGEDGTLQGFLLSYGLKVVGASVTASAVCFDKHLSKTVLRAAGVPVTPGVHVTARAWATGPDAVTAEILEHPGPWFVKPNRGGSSIGTAGPVGPAGLSAAIELALGYDRSVLVEEFIPHRELMVGVMVGFEPAEELLVSHPLESVPVDGVLDFAAKYQRSSIGFPPPDDLSGEQRTQIGRIALAAVRALECESLCRVDLLLDTRSGQFLVNEVNTMPGLTERSAFTQLMGTLGRSYGTTLSALGRAADRQRSPIEAGVQT